MMAEIERLYSPARWTQNTDPFSEERVREAILSVNMKGSPGYPLCLQWQTNGALLQEPPKGLGIDALTEMVLNRVKSLQDNSVSDVEVLSDPIRWFIKAEGHTPEKAANKRWRLIWSVSVVDQIIDRCLWSNMLQADIENWTKIPTKSGYSAKYGTTNRLFYSLEDTGEFCKGDKSSWDITTPGWILDDNLEINFRLCTNFDENADWVKIARRRHVVLYSGMRVTSDGYLYKQTLFGVTPSGSLLTLLYNSRSQVMLKFLSVSACSGRKFDWELDKVYAIGDDSLEKLRGLTKEKYLDYVNGLGFIFNDFDQGRLIDLEFCSRRFHRLQTGQVVTIPVNWNKHIAHLCLREKWNEENVIDALLSLCIEYAFDDEHFLILHNNLVALNKAKAISQNTCKYYLTGDEKRDVYNRVDGDKFRLLKFIKNSR